MIEREGVRYRALLAFASMVVVRTWLLLLIAGGAACTDEPTAADGSSSTGDPAPGCSKSRHEGPFELPEGVVGEHYEVRLFDYASVGGVGIMVTGEIPMGLEVRESELFGVLEESGMFELVLSAREHWVPPGCQSPGPSTATFTLTVVEEQPSGSSTSSG